MNGQDRSQILCKHRSMLAAALLSMGCVASPNVVIAEVPGWRPTIEVISFENGAGLSLARAIGGPGADQAYDIWAAADGSYVIVGSTERANGDVDLATAKLDNRGNLIWARTFGGNQLDIGFAVRVLPNGTIVIAGWTRSLGAGEGDFYLLGLRPDGSTAFERTFGGPGEERATALTLTQDGGIAILGETYSHGAGDGRFYLVKTDGTGLLQWERTYDAGPLHERGLAIVANADGYLLVGNSMDSRSGSTAVVSDGYIVRTDQMGRERWNRRFGGDAHDILHHATSLAAGGYLLTGYTRGFGARGESDLWLVHIDDVGQTLGTQLLGGTGGDHNVMARGANAGCVFAAGYSETAAGDQDAHVIGLSPRLSVDWERTFGGAANDVANSVFAAENELAIAGGVGHTSGNTDILFALFAISHCGPK